jgi:hypothetical protein
MYTTMQPSILRMCKKARTLGLRHVDGQSQLSVYVGDEVEHFVIQGQMYEGKYPDAQGDLRPLSGFYTTNSTNDTLFSVMLGYVREGDVLSAIWWEGNNNKYISDSTYHGDLRPYSKLYRDEVYLRVTRTVRGKEDDGRKFLIGVSVCADNPMLPDNSDRICRRG